MKFLVLFVSIAVIGAVSADVSHLAKADGYSYNQPSSNHHHSASQHYSLGETGSVLSAGLGKSYSPIVESYEPIQAHSLSHAPLVSELNAQIIYGKPNPEVSPPVYHHSSIPASGPAYPELTEEYQAAPVQHHTPALGSSDSHRYLPPAQDLPLASGHEYFAPIQSHPAEIYSSPISIEQKLHHEHHEHHPSSQVAPSPHYLPPQEHHHASVEQNSAHVEYNSIPEHHHEEHHHEEHYGGEHLHENHHHHHEDHLHHHEEHHHHANQHHEQQHHAEHYHGEQQHEVHHHSAAEEYHSAPAPAEHQHYHHHHEEYSAPASQTGGYHYSQPLKRYRHRS